MMEQKQYDDMTKEMNESLAVIKDSLEAYIDFANFVVEKNPRIAKLWKKEHPAMAEQLDKAYARKEEHLKK